MAVSWVPRIGDEFGAYRVEGMIGHGGMSIVYRARHLTLERTVALKLLSPELGEDESFRERFVRESRLAAALDHPNVIPIYEAGEENGVLYIAMRYVTGSNLKALLQREGPLDPADTVSIIGQISSALNAAHEQMGLVHRDVKPANILVVESEGPGEPRHVYISDFGIAKQQSSSVLTRTGMFVGTAGYASPEQIEGKELDRRADVYSIGCVLYECLTGSPVYDKDSEVAVMYAHLLEPPPSVRSTRPELPPQIDEVIAKAMAKNRDERYATTKEFAAAVRDALSPERLADRTAAPASETVLSAPAGATALAAVPAAATPAATGAPAAAGAAPGVEVTAPPAETPAETPAARSSWFSRHRRMIVAAIVAAILVAGAAVAAVLLTNGGTSTPAAKPSGGGGAAPTTLLGALMPTGIAAECRTDATPSEGAIETESCTPPANAPTFFPDRFSFSFYPSAAALASAYGKEKSSMAIGDCGGVPGEKTWIHVSTGKTGGRRVCGSDEGGNSVIAWTHEKLGSVDHVDMLGIAHATSRGADLFRWWNAVNDDVGKCRPKLPENQCLAIVTKFEPK